jgi:lysine-N-methylase
MAQFTVVIPTQTAGFSCIGDRCEDNCCRCTTWTITVDEDTYKKYQKVEGELGERLMASIEGEEGKRRFKFTAGDGRCLFLLEGGLCELHKDLGPDFLCMTCKTYPRITKWFNRTLEHSLNLSCPPVVRDYIYSRNKFEFSERVLNNETIPPAPGPYEADAHKIRAMIFGMVIYNKFTLMDKLAYIGMFMRSLAKIPKDEKFSASVDETISMYHKNLYEKGIMDGLHESRKNVDKDLRKELLIAIARIAALSIMAPEVSPEESMNSKLYELIRDFRGSVLNEGEMDRAIGAFDRIVVPYVNDNPHVFENYLFYEIYTTQFPKDSVEGFIEGYIALVGEFLSVLVFAAGMFRKGKRLRDWEMIGAIYLFHRTVSHNLDRRKKVGKIFESIGLGEFLGTFGAIK